MDSPDAPSRGPAWRRLWPLLLLAGGLALAYALGLHRYLSFDALAANRSGLTALVRDNPLLAGAGYMLVYVLVVAFSLPGGAVMTLSGGFLFGTWIGAGLTVVGATIGACALFLLARHALAETLAAKAGPLLGKVRDGLQRDGFLYLLSMRLLPIVPFWLANLAPALAGMRLLPYAGATLLGIIPGTLVFSGIGAGLGAVFDAGGRPNLSLIFSPGILLPLVGLAALSLLGAWWRGRQRRREEGDAHA